MVFNEAYEVLIKVLCQEKGNGAKTVSRVSEQKLVYSTRILDISHLKTCLVEEWPEDNWLGDQAASGTTRQVMRSARRRTLRWLACSKCWLPLYCVVCVFILWTGSTLAAPILNKKAVLSQRRPRDAPYISLPWEFLRVPDYVHAPLFPKFLSAFCSDWACECSGQIWSW